MNAVHRQFDAPTDDLFVEFADPCTVTRDGAGPIPMRCIVDDGVAQMGEYGQIIGRVTHVSFVKAEWCPKRGDVVTLADGRSKSVEIIDSDDGLVVECTVNA